MKFNSSSSTSFSANLGCFSGFLSKVLCSKIQPTYPSDFETSQQFSKIEKIIEGSATPNVVARLMGLEFMPEINSKDDKKECNSISRSKSMNSGENRAETEEIQGQHRRVKTSFSFKETPNYFEIEDDNFVVLTFEKKGKKIKKGVNFAKCEMGKKHKKCRRKQSKNREEQGKNRVVFSDEERVNLKISSQICQGFDNDFEVSEQSYHLLPYKDKILEVSKGEIECELENYSPISVLDDSEFVSETEVTVSSYSEEDAKSRGSEYDTKESSPTSNENCSLDEKQTKINEGQKIGLKRREYSKQESVEMLRKVYNLAEKDFYYTNWKYKGIFTPQEFEETRLNFSQLIFDQMISELVDQLIGI